MLEGEKGRRWRERLDEKEPEEGKGGANEGERC